MDKRETFFRVISPDHLYFTAAIFGIATLVLVAVIYLYLYAKKRNYKIKERILETLNEWIGEMMVEQSEPEINIPPGLAKFFRKEDNRHFIIESLINIKKNLTGATADTTVYLYEKLNLRHDSLKKLKSAAWHNKTQGIYELYMMNQRDQQAAIFEYTNSKNEYVRMEAQTAVIGFSGFEGLVFLDNLTYPLHEWQQIKLLEQLAAIDSDAMPNLPVWLRSPNDYVVQFALKLADIYQQFHVNEIVVDRLKSDNERIRYQAIKTLGIIANETTANALIEQYPAETIENKLEIIKQLAVIGGSDDLPFLTERLKEEDDSLVIEASRAIISGNNNGWQILEQYLSSPSIYKQIKQEFA